MIPVTSPVLYQNALAQLVQHKQSVGSGFKGRFIQIFLAIKFYQNTLPSIYSGSYIATELLQSLLDDLYAKMSRPPNNCVLALFENNYLARTGLTAPGNSGPQNTWRNNLNLQKGIGCYAPVADLSSLTFLNQSRLDCRYLRTTTPDQLSGASCTVCTRDATYRSEDHRKWLQINPTGSGYAVLDTQLTDNYLPYVVPNGQRLPFYPIAVAMYHDADAGLSTGNRRSVSVNDFMSDFNLSSQEFEAYFDDSPTNRFNAAMRNSPAWQNPIPVPILQTTTLTVNQPAPPTSPITIQPSPHPVIGTPVAPPPSINSGWEAEQFVESALRSSGWDACVVSRQQLGYDIFASKGRRHLRVEVKSSLGLCSPSLTSREWQQSVHYGRDYVLAIIENFNPDSENSIFWVADPRGSCSSTPRNTVTYRISRNAWMSAAITLSQL